MSAIFRRFPQLVAILVVLALVSLIVLAPRSDAQGSADFPLTLLYTSENHGQWEPYAPVANAPTVGGIARRASLVKQLRAENPHTLLVDSGDISQRSLLFPKYQGQEGRDLYNAVGYDVVTLGNHEFDYGPKTLLDKFVTGANFDIVAANTDYSVEPGLTSKVKPYVMREVGGQKVGVVGVMHAYLATSVSPSFKVRSMDPYAAVKDAVQALEAQGVNKIVVLSHMGYDARKVGLGYDDLGLASAVDGIDVIVGGHDATVLGDPATLPSWIPKPSGPNPTVVQGPSGRPVLVVNDYQWGALLGRLDVTFDGDGVAKTWQDRSQVVSDKLSDDPTVASIYANLSTALEAVRKEIVGHSAADLPGERGDVRGGEAALGNLVADAMLAATAADHSQVALMNGGGIRVSLKAGDISRGDVLTVLPFGNSIITLDVKGTNLLAALENGVSQVSVDSPASGGGRFPQLAGLRFTADLSQPVGRRVQKVEVADGASGYQPLDPTKTYRVATNDFMAAGGDGYTALAQGTAPNKTDILLADAVAEYLKAKGNVSPKVEGRIVLTGRPTSQAVQPTAAPAAQAAQPTAAPSVTAVPAAASVSASPTAAITPPVARPALAPTAQVRRAAQLPPTGDVRDEAGWLILVGGAVVAVGAGLYLARRRQAG